MTCDAIISKMRDELLSRAISVMHEQIEKKRISLEGNVPAMSGEASEKEKDAFLLAQIVKEHENMERQFGQYIEQAKIGQDSLQRIDELQRFLLELRQIVMLNDYSKTCESWMADAEKELKEQDAVRILSKTLAKGDGKRKDVLAFVIRDKGIEKDGIFSNEEREIMSAALSAS